MKKQLKICLLALFAVVLCLLVFPTSAQATSESDLTFALNTDGKSYYVSDCSTSASGDLVIPANYNNKPVTSIGDFAFYNCGNLTSITIPDSVTSIGNYVFNGCYSLRYNIYDNGEYLGNPTNPYLYLASTTSTFSTFTIHSSTKLIGSFAFYYYCDSLQNITIPDSVTSIGYYAFANCNSLQSVTIGNGVTSIGHSAFKDCNSLQSVTFGNSITSIGDYAFDCCTSLQSIIIPDSVTTIGYCAFLFCTSLQSITVPDSVTSIGDDAFSYCPITKLIIAEGSKTVTSTMIICESQLQEVVIPDSVTSIGHSAFKDCNSLQSVTFGNSITSIGDYAFDCCTSLQSIIIPDNVTTIGYFAFENCTSLQSITIPDSVTSILNGAFFFCTSLQSITIPDSVTSIGGSAFGYCTSLQSITIPYSVTIIGGSAFGYCNNLTSITIPEGVTSIGDYAFSSCSSLTSITIPDSVTSIGNSAFSSCTSLTSITIPDSVTSINKDTFFDCDQLTDVFYYGTESQKNWISFESGNTCISRAKWHYDTEEIVLGSQVIYQCSYCDQYQYPNSDGSVFADISNTSWQTKFAIYACQKGLMAGKGTDGNGKIKFDPNSPISREEFAQVLYNAENKPSVTIANRFPDVANNSWYKNAVLWANQAGIASGMGDGRFGVGKNITRQDLAMMLYKYAKMKNCDLTATEGMIDQFADGDKVAGYAKTAMDWAVTNRILSGKGTAGADISTFRLDPAGTATRAECAAMLKNFMEAFGL